LLRHPIDTCISHINAFGKNERYEKKIEIPDWMNNDRFIEHSKFINQLDSLLESRVAYWCLNNCSTIEQLGSLKVNVVFYSDLLMNPQVEIERIVKDSNLITNDFDFKLLSYRKASKTNFKDEFIEDSEEQLNKNFKTLDIETKDKLQVIFDYFGLKLYNAYSPFPNKEILTKDKSVIS
jgi:hypothetical protein